MRFQSLKLYSRLLFLFFYFFWFFIYVISHLLLIFYIRYFIFILFNKYIITFNYSIFLYNWFHFRFWDKNTNYTFSYLITKSSRRSSNIRIYLISRNPIKIRGVWNFKVYYSFIFIIYITNNSSNLYFKFSSHNIWCFNYL